MAVPFAKFTTKKWVVLASKIDQLFIVIGIIRMELNKCSEIAQEKLMLTRHEL